MLQNCEVNKKGVKGRSCHFVLTGDVVGLKEVYCLQNWSWADFSVFTNELGTESRSVL